MIEFKNLESLRIMLELVQFTLLSDEGDQIQMGYFEESEIIEQTLQELRKELKSNPSGEESQDINELRKQAYLARQKDLEQERGTKNQNQRSVPTDYQSQIQEYRKSKKQEYLRENTFNGKNVITLGQLDQKRQDDYEKSLQMRNAPEKKLATSKVITMDQIDEQVTIEKSKEFEREILRLTNEYRKIHNKAPVEWNEQLRLVGMPHSKRQAQNRHIDHDGFNARCQQVGFRKVSMCENVAMCSSYPNIPKVIVDGWYNSPGHKKNMLSDSNVCGISAYKNSSTGEWYFTQLFAKKC